VCKSGGCCLATSTVNAACLCALLCFGCCSSTVASRYLANKVDAMVVKAMCFPSAVQRGVAFPCATGQEKGNPHPVWLCCTTVLVVSVQQCLLNPSHTSYVYLMVVVQCWHHDRSFHCILVFAASGG
jgi:hypothetical protein